MSHRSSPEVGNVTIMVVEDLMNKSNEMTSVPIEVSTISSAYTNGGFERTSIESGVFDEIAGGDIEKAENGNLEANYDDDGVSDTLASPPRSPGKE